MLWLAGWWPPSCGTESVFPHRVGALLRGQALPAYQEHPLPVQPVPFLQDPFPDPQSLPRAPWGPPLQATIWPYNPKSSRDRAAALQSPGASAGQHGLNRRVRDSHRHTWRYKGAALRRAHTSPEVPLSTGRWSTGPPRLAGTERGQGQGQAWNLEVGHDHAWKVGMGPGSRGTSHGQRDQISKHMFANTLHRHIRQPTPVRGWPSAMGPCGLFLHPPH